MPGVTEKGYTYNVSEEIYGKTGRLLFRCKPGNNMVNIDNICLSLIPLSVTNTLKNPTFVEGGELKLHVDVEGGKAPYH